MINRRLAIVVQRYGEEVNGGAELHARWLAEKLLQLGEVEVITTCALEYTTWANVYRPGKTEINGVVVHRFPVDVARNWQTAQEETGYIVTHHHSLVDEMKWVQKQGPLSTALLHYIENHRHLYDWFIFFTYSYATTVLGLPLVADKAILVPTAHDEPYIRFPVYRPVFQLPMAIVYNTESEKQLVQAITFNKHKTIHVVAGVGINVPEQVQTAGFQQKHQLPEQFLLYLGRITAGKNVPELLEFFLRYQAEQPNPLKLVLAGKSDIPIPNHPAVQAIGFLNEEEKFAAITLSQMLVMPSLYESLSMIALEAWLMRRPMLVNGRCEVLRQQCLRSQAGLFYDNYEEFAAALNHLRQNPALRQQFGDNGHVFVLQNYHWDIILAKYQAVFETLENFG